MAPKIVSTPASSMVHQPDTTSAVHEQSGQHDNAANDADYMDSGLVAVLFDD